MMYIVIYEPIQDRAVNEHLQVHFLLQYYHADAEYGPTCNSYVVEGQYTELDSILLCITPPLCNMVCESKETGWMGASDHRFLSSVLPESDVRKIQLLCLVYDGFQLDYCNGHINIR